MVVSELVWWQLPGQVAEDSPFAVVEDRYDGTLVYSVTGTENQEAYEGGGRVNCGWGIGMTCT